MKGVFEAVPPDGDIHILAGILSSAGAQTIETQSIGIGTVPIILAAGIQLAEDQLPVISLLLLIPIHRAAPTKVFYLEGAIQEPSNADAVPIARPGFIDSVGHDLKDSVFATLQAI